MTTIYRACDGYTGAKSCWSPDRETASAYTDNQGFGGSQIVEMVADGKVLDLRTRHPLVALAEAIGADDPREQAQDWMDRGLTRVYEVWEDRGNVWDALQEYDWIIHDQETYPDGATTYVRVSE